jgi:hypothetical protein
MIIIDFTDQIIAENLLAINPKLAFAEEIEAKPTPEDYMFNNPGEATKKAKEMGLDGIHSHKDGDKTIFMPGPSHKALMDKIESDASI